MAPGALPGARMAELAVAIDLEVARALGRFPPVAPLPIAPLQVAETVN